MQQVFIVIDEWGWYSITKRWNRSLILFHAELGLTIHPNHVDPKKATGNHHSNSKIHWNSFIQSTIYHITTPKATTDEICIHLFNHKIQGTHHSLHCKFCNWLLLGLTWMTGITTFHEIHLPINFAKYSMYFNMIEPFGITSTPISGFIIQMAKQLNIGNLQWWSIQSLFM